MQHGGSLVTMSYLGADEAVPHYGLMGPVKAALESLVRYMALELGPLDIRVSAVSPGPILTRAASGIGDFDQLIKHAIEKAPLGRLVTTEEVANLTAFLCSDDSSGMTGHDLPPINHLQSVRIKLLTIGAIHEDPKTAVHLRI
jgi:enoyl-[acyl-carrier protein] reductase I